MARTPDGLISHVRNLDFSYTDVMMKLVYNAKLIKGGQLKAEAPTIGGFYGVYTAHKTGAYSFSYNVRETENFISL